MVDSRTVDMMLAPRTEQLLLPAPARLIYLVGASGAGKDTLLQYCRDRLPQRSEVVLAHRYVTRAAHAREENVITLTRREFAAREALHLFALSWRSHGHDYGIGIEINQWMAKGITVLVNGSRTHLEQARRRYPDLVPVWISVPHDVLRRRLFARAREDAEQIETRLLRALIAPRPPPDAIVIANDGALADAGEALLAVIAPRVATWA